MEKTECPICIKKTCDARIFKCPHCLYKCCKPCYQTYLLNNDDGIARCVNSQVCDREFSTMLIFGELSGCFRKEYTRKMGRLALQREKQSLPLLQDEALLKIKREHYNKISIGINNLISRLKSVNIWISSHGYLDAIARGTTCETDDESGEERTSSRSCSRPGCSGFLSTRWKCMVCELITCRQCGVSKNNPDSHECLPDDVASMELVRKDSKPCPKCSSMIYKISGCSQMYCVKCFTAFDWTTLRIERGRIHNPHYYEIQRQLSADGQIPREAGDLGVVLDECANGNGVGNRLIQLGTMVDESFNRLAVPRISITLKNFNYSTVWRTFIYKHKDLFLRRLTEKLIHLQNYEIENMRRRNAGENEHRRSLALTNLANNMMKTISIPEIDAAMLSNIPFQYRGNRGFMTEQNYTALEGVLQLSSKFRKEQLAQQPIHPGDLDGMTLSITPPRTNEGNSIDQKWEAELCAAETGRLKRTEFVDILQTFVVGAIDLTFVFLRELGTFADRMAVGPQPATGNDNEAMKSSLQEEFESFSKKINRLRKVCNAALAKTCVIFNCTRRKISAMSPLMGDWNGKGIFMGGTSGYESLQFKTTDRKRKRAVVFGT